METTASPALMVIWRISPRLEATVILVKSNLEGATFSVCILQHLTLSSLSAPVILFVLSLPRLSMEAVRRMAESHWLCGHSEEPLIQTMAHEWFVSSQEILVQLQQCYEFMVKKKKSHII